MTSTLTRERIEQYAKDPRMCNINDEIRELASMALAAMDSEPVAVPDHLTYIREPTLENILSDTEENSPMSHAARILAREVKFWRSVPLYRHAQPAPVVPDEKPMPNPLSMYVVDAVAAIAEVKGWNACRAAMLQAGNSPVIPDGSEQRIAEAVDLLKCAAPAMLADDSGPNGPLVGRMKAQAVPGWIPVNERMPHVGDIVLTAINGCTNVGEMERSGANYRYFTSVISGRELPATHWMPLPAAPQEVK